MGKRFVALTLGLALAGPAARARAKSDLWREHDAANPAAAAIAPPFPSLSPMVKAVKPAVVNIYTTQITRQNVDPMMEEFLRHFYGAVPQRETEQHSLGSGFIVNAKGIVVTNNHVVANASEIRVRLADGREFVGQTLGRDPKTDIAVVKLKNAPGDLPSVFLGDSEAMEPGDFVVAIGNPLGLDHSVSFGIVSAKERVIGAGPYDDFIQTDATINPGNSGGPLFNTRGEVIGVNTAIVNPSQGQGIGFAVPINMVKEVVPQLFAAGRVVRGWLGIATQNLTPAIAHTLGLERTSGAVVSQIYQDQPADKAGIEVGDVIVAVNGKRVENYNQMSWAVASVPPGKQAMLTVLREGKERQVSVKVAEMPQQGQELVARGERQALRDDRLGLGVQQVTPRLARAHGLDRPEGVVVMDVRADGPAERAGIGPGDLILEVDRKRVRTVADYRRLVAQAGGDLVLLRVQRENTALYIAVRD